MSTPEQDPAKKKTLSEISHLFLSSIRDRQTDGAARPKRTPPGPQKTEGQAPTPAPQDEPMQDSELTSRCTCEGEEAAAPAAAAPVKQPSGDLSIDLSPEEFAQVFGEPQLLGIGEAEGPTPRAVPVSAVIGSHLNGKQFDRVKEYARHLATQAGRVGLIELDASEFRLMCFEPMTAQNNANSKNNGGSAGAGGEGDGAVEWYDPRQMAEALEEMNWDVDRWLLLIPNPRVPEARTLLREVDHWVLLSTCDHDGVVGSYRTLKGLAEAHRGDGAAPKLSLALLDAATEVETRRVFGKLSGVCQQFLEWPLQAEPAVRKTYRVAEHLVMLCRPTRDKGQFAMAPQWSVVGEFLTKMRAAKANSSTATETATEAAAAPTMPPAISTVLQARELVADMVVPAAVPAAPIVEAKADQVVPVELHVPIMTTEPAFTAQVQWAPEPPIAPTTTPIAAAPIAAAPIAATTTNIRETSDVIELDGAEATAESMLSAVLRQTGGGFVECPVRAPMCDDVRLAVGRDRGVVLFAVAERGLGGLRAIGQAYRWLMENRALIGMAVPQFAIDAGQTPRLRLLVDESDVSAEVLQPMLHAGSVTVQGYRKLRWGGRAGLLLEAA